MPRIEDYEALAPFTLDELVDAANSLLRDRPTLRIQVRTVRYYISKGLVPPPSGAPKFARYGMDHLRRIVQIREGLDQGRRLHELDPNERPTAPARTPAPAPLRLEESQPPNDYRPRLPKSEAVRRFQLTPNSSWEVKEGVDLDREIERALRALQDIRSSFFDTT